MKSDQPVHYSDNFKRNVVRHYRSNNVSMRETAELFGITCGTVSKWSTLFSEEFENALYEEGESVGSETVNQLRTEINELRNELRILKNLVKKRLLLDLSLFPPNES